MINLKTIMITIISLAVIAFAFNAFAQGGMGWDGGWGHHGRGWHHGGAYGPGYDAQMNQEDYKLFQEKREAFLKETEDLRTNLYEKERALQNELAQSEPDAAKASSLQKEISELQARLDQKRIDHMIEVRKSTPNAGGDVMPGGPMMGYGPRGGGCRR